MGKSSKYPSYSSGTVTLNGNTVASTSKKGNTVNSTYNMPETEKNIYDYAQNSFLTSLPQINVFSNDTRKDINSQLEAYKNRGVQTINDIYDPIMDDLKNDVASRFDNLNNSIFMDNLNDIEENRAAAISDLAQDIANDAAHGGKVVGEQLLQIGQGVRSPVEHLAHVADVEQAAGLTHGHVLADHARGILHRQHVAREGHHAPFQRHVAVIQRRLELHCHSPF